MGGIRRSIAKAGMVVVFAQGTGHLLVRFCSLDSIAGVLGKDIWQ